MLKIIAVLVSMLWFHYDFFVCLFFQIRGANWREEFISQTEPDGGQANGDMSSFTPPALPQTESNTPTLVMPTSMISVFDYGFLTVLLFLQSPTFSKAYS